MGETSLYRTSDLYYAAYLRCAGVLYKGVEWITEQDRNGKTKRRGCFLFEDQGSYAMRQLKDQYFQDRAKVSALSLGQAIRDMKADLFRNR